MRTRSIPSASSGVAERMTIPRRVGSDAVEVVHILVVGAGQMGGGIAQVVAASGRRVSLFDPAPGAVEHAFETMRRSLAKLGLDPDETLARISAVDDLVEADVMIEAVVEDATVK